MSSITAAARSISVASPRDAFAFAVFERVTPFGRVRWTEGADGVREVRLIAGPVSAEEDAVTSVADRNGFSVWLEAYLEKRDASLPGLAPQGTPFQRQVWETTLRIPRGQTRSYAEIAAAIGRPKAFRAVARALATNPWWLVIPCHRVIASGGRLGGYAGGVDIKERLLAWERA